MSVLAPGPVPALASVPPSGGSAGASDPADFGALVVTSLLALTLLAVLAAVVAPRPVAAVLILTAAVALPGAAITLRLKWGDTVTAIAITVALGLAIDIFAALAMVWSGWWHPMAAAAIVGAVSALTLVCAVRRPWRFATVKVDDSLRTVIALVPAVAS